MKSQGFPVGVILDANYNADHKDHIHVEGAPVITGNPKDPTTWGTGSSSNATGGTTPTSDSSGTSIGDLNWWDAFINPDKVGDAFNEIVLRFVFGLIAIIAAVVTVVIVVGAFKGEVAGAAINTVVGKVAG
jgi:hypothetical protein